MKIILSFLAVICFTTNFYGQSWVDLMLQKESNFYDVQAAFEAEWAGKSYERGKGYKQYKRWEYFMKDRIMPDGTFPKGQVLDDFRYLMMHGSHATRAGNGDWQPNGPFSHTRTGSWSSGTGRLNCVTEDPNNSNIIYAGAPSGGAWKTTDGGSTWTPLSDQFSTIGISEIAVDPNNSNIIFMATGDRDGGDTYSIGLVRSTDAGANWSTVFSTSDQIYDVLIDPTNSNNVWIATSSAIWKSTDGGDNFSGLAGGSFKDLEFKPGDYQTVYAVTSSRLYRTTNGSTFSQITSGLPSTSGRLALAVTPANSNYVYILSAQTDYSFQGVYRSTDSGSNFSAMNTTDDIFGGSSQAWYDMAICASTSDANTIFCGVLDIHKSTDGGANFTQINSWSNPSGASYTHADIHYLRYYNGNFYAGTDGGIYKSTDNGSNFTDLSEGLQIGQYYTIAGSQNDVNVIIGGLQDNGGYFYNGTDWLCWHGADGMEAGIDPNNSNRIYGMVQYGDLYRSTNGGASQNSIGAPSGESGEWVTPMQMDPNNPRLLAGYTQLYEYDFSSGWNQLTNFSFGGNLTALEIFEGNSNIVYMARNQDLFVTTNNGTNVTDLSGNLPTLGGGQNITSIEVNPDDSNELWISISGWNSSRKVYHSTDGGSNWTNLSTGLPNLPCNIVKYDRGTNGAIYVGTDVGVYYRDNVLGSWIQYMDNLPNVIVKDLEINESAQIIRAGTYGRGVWESPTRDQIAFCEPSPTNGTTNGDFIDGVELETISNTSTGAAGGPSYNDYTAQSADIYLGNSYAITITSGNVAGNYYAAWIDYNNNGDFTDVGEKLNEIQIAGANSTGVINFSVPNGLTLGSSRLRIRCLDTPSIDPCDNGNEGETEDYKVVLSEITYCTPGTTNGTGENDYIDGVELGSISNTGSGSNTGPDYTDYTADHSTDLMAGSSYVVTVTNGAYAQDVIAVWIDYNRNGDFTDAGEKLGEVITSTANTPHTISFTVPASASEGETRMRVRLVYNSLNAGLDPCADGDYGEAEDYRINMLTLCSGFSANETITNPSCGNSNGSINLVVSGGTTPYSYVWGNGASTSGITSLAAGSYFVTVSEQGGCTIEESYLLSDPGNPVITLNGINGTCGNSNGSASSSVSGGSQPYTYLWSNGATTEDLSSLAKAVYHLTVTDNNGCSSVESVTIDNPGAITATLGLTHPSCLNNDGEIDAVLTGGTAPYSFIWTTGDNTATITGLGSGFYTAIIEDAFGCSKSAVGQLTITNPLSHTITNSSETCSSDNGEASIFVSGGFGGFSYTWSNGMTSAQITGLTSANYSVTATDINGCKITTSTMVDEITPPVVSLSENNPSCNIDNGSIAGEISGGATPYQYAWSTGETAATITGLGEFSYSLTITDANSCTDSKQSSTLANTGVPVISVSATDPLCFNEDNGSIVLNVSGASSPYSYSWNIGGGQSSKTNLSDGNFTYTVSDVNGCSASGQTSLTAAIAPVITVTSSDALCGSATGSATVDVITGNSPYTYLWSDLQTVQNAQNLSSGTHNVTVTDVNGCNYVESVSVSSNNDLVVSANAVDVLCNGAEDGTITIVTSGGTAPFTYSWTGFSETSSVLSNLDVGTYQYDVEDALGCTGSGSATISEPSLIQITVTKADAMCGEDNGSAQVQVDGGTSGYTYLWSNGLTAANITGLSSGVYTVSVIDNNDCLQLAYAQIGSGGVATIQTFTGDVACNGGSDGYITVLATGPVGPFEYIWNNGATTSSLPDIEAGNYNVEITDKNDCSYLESFTISEPAALLLTLSSIDETYIDDCDGVASVEKISGGTSPYAYAWSNGNQTESTSGLCDGNYSITISDNNNCEIIGSVSVSPGDTAETGTGIFAQQELEVLQVMPNPSNGNFTIHMEGDFKDLEISVMSIDGKVMFMRNTIDVVDQYDLVVALDDVASGTYILNVAHQNGVIQKKLVVQK